MTEKRIEELLKLEFYQNAHVDQFKNLALPPFGEWRVFVDFLVSRESDNLKKLGLLHRVKIQIQQEAKKYAKYPEIEEFVDLEIKHVVYLVNLEKGIVEIPDLRSSEQSSDSISLPPISKTPDKENSPIRWKGNITQLTTMFYRLHKDLYIDNTKSELERWILFNFVDKHGKQFKESTIKTLLNESKEDKRANVGAEFEPDSLFSGESD